MPEFWLHIGWVTWVHQTQKFRQRARGEWEWWKWGELRWKSTLLQIYPKMGCINSMMGSTCCKCPAFLPLFGDWNIIVCISVRKGRLWTRFTVDPKSADFRCKKKKQEKNVCNVTKNADDPRRCTYSADTDKSLHTRPSRNFKAGQVIRSSSCKVPLFFSQSFMIQLLSR